jgi:hypothetical protein
VPGKGNPGTDRLRELSLLVRVLLVICILTIGIARELFAVQNTQQARIIIGSLVRDY